MPRLCIGTSGWMYDDWRGVLYDEGVPKKRWLRTYTGAFPTVEVNNTFYRLPERSTFESWHEQTPEGFTMAIKASRYLTHVKRLREPEEPVARLLDRASGLGARLGPVLVQLPPDQKAELGRLEEVLRAFPRSVRVAVEPRHESWWSDELRALLSEHDAALSFTDRRSQVTTPVWRTASWGYLRLHQGRASPWPHYGRTALRSWVDRLAECYSAGDEVFVFFNNDPGGWAVRDARTMARIAGNRGLEVVPPARPDSGRAAEEAA